MSLSNTRSRTVGSSPYCKVCFDAGKTKKEYTSHFVKSSPGPSGVVVCPTLLRNKCSICYNFGHIKSYCPDLLEMRKNSEKNQRMIDSMKYFATKEMKKNEEKQVSRQKQSPFSILMSLTDSDDEEKIEIRPPSQVAEVKVVKTTSWANIVTMAAPVIAPTLTKKPRQKKVEKKKISWASDTETDSSDDEEEE